MGGGALKGGMEMGMDGLRGGGVKRETERQFKKRGGGGGFRRDVDNKNHQIRQCKP